MRVIQPPRNVYDLKFLGSGKKEVVEMLNKTEDCGAERKVLLFSPSEALKAFCVDFLSQEKITAWVIEKLHPAGPHCPSCNVKITDKTTLNNFYTLRRCKCKSCNAWFSAFKSTALHHAGLDVSEIFLIAIFSEMKVEAKKIADVLKCHADTVQSWQARFKAMEAMIE